MIHGKNNFAEILKNLIRYRSKNNFVEPQNNYSLSVDDNLKNFNILATSSSVLHNYFDGSNKMIYKFK